MPLIYRSMERHKEQLEKHELPRLRLQLSGFADETVQSELNSMLTTVESEILQAVEIGSHVYNPAALTRMNAMRDLIKHLIKLRNVDSYAASLVHAPVPQHNSLVHNEPIAGAPTAPNYQPI